MTRMPPNDLDYLAAGLHGRRSRMAEGGRLDELCRCRSLGDITREVFQELEPTMAPAFQRHCVQALIREISSLEAALTGAGGRLIGWLVVRFQVENVKVLLRGCMGGIPLTGLHAHLAGLPKALALDIAALAGAKTPAAFARLLPDDRFRDGLERALGAEPEMPRLFFLEAALERTYLEELLNRARHLAGEDGEDITALAQQEADHFHLMLVGRGKFLHQLPTAQLLPLHIPGTRILRVRFAAMLDDPDLRTAMGRAVGRALDAVPPESGMVGTNAAADPARLEALAWDRFVRLANRAFRRGHVGLGAIAGYASLRRVEAANLTTLSEGIRIGIAAEALRARMIPHASLEGAHV